MEPLQITTGEKRIPIVRDGVPVGEIVFNPSDALFAEKFYRLIGNLQTTLGEYKTKANALDDNALDGNGLPLDMDARVALVKDACLYVRGEIDSLFGPGTSAMVFGDSMVLSAFEQFLSGLVPFIQAARVSKVQQYTKKRK